MERQDNWAEDLVYPVLVPGIKIMAQGVVPLNYDLTPGPNGLQTLLCRYFLTQYALPLSHMNRRRHSYSYKHLVERVYRSPSTHGDRLRKFVRTELYKPEEYLGFVSNGAFIEAALWQGFVAERLHPTSPNCYFNFRLAVDLDREIMAENELWADRIRRSREI